MTLDTCAYTQKSHNFEASVVFVSLPIHISKSHVTLFATREANKNALSWADSRPHGNKGANCNELEQKLRGAAKLPRAAGHGNWKQMLRRRKLTQIEVLPSKIFSIFWWSFIASGILLTCKMMPSLPANWLACIEVSMRFRAANEPSRSCWKLKDKPDLYWLVDERGDTLEPHLPEVELLGADGECEPRLRVVQ